MFKKNNVHDGSTYCKFDYCTKYCFYIFKTQSAKSKKNGNFVLIKAVLLKPFWSLLKEVICQSRFIKIICSELCQMPPP